MHHDKGGEGHICRELLGNFEAFCSVLYLSGLFLSVLFCSVPYCSVPYCSVPLGDLRAAIAAPGCARCECEYTHGGAESVCEWAGVAVGEGSPIISRVAAAVQPSQLSIASRDVINVNNC